ncbi:PREDICTED: uncharacterized protein LOC108619555 [Drosophila arizonae]|uniref:Uncharacterized protein LOC108619555 n=1 Tax=Drosophila arizonae TaxID=7263 RepID=A0ABM1PWW2_DROAR|nr:PREDICTED: uncharacterized protein LOC108619555 [Drosophila arizonae]
MEQQIKQLYYFDAILEKSTLKHKPGEPCPYTYMVCPYKQYLKVTDDRIYGKEFPDEALGEFVANPYELAESLTSKGIRLAIYENGQLLGCGSFRPIDDILRPLTEPTFTATGAYTVDAEQEGVRVARVDFNIKFSAADPQLDSRMIPFGCFDICRTLDTSINPRDIIFTLGRSKRTAAVACITDKRLMSFGEAPFSCVRKEVNSTAGCGCVLHGTDTVVPKALDRSKECERELLNRLLIELEYDKMLVPTPPPTHALSRQFNGSRQANYSRQARCRPGQQRCG